MTETAIARPWELDEKSSLVNQHEALLHARRQAPEAPDKSRLEPVVAGFLTSDAMRRYLRLNTGAATARSNLAAAEASLDGLNQQLVSALADAQPVASIEESLEQRRREIERLRARLEPMAAVLAPARQKCLEDYKQRTTTASHEWSAEAHRASEAAIAKLNARLQEPLTEMADAKVLATLGGRFPSLDKVLRDAGESSPADEVEAELQPTG